MTTRWVSIAVLLAACAPKAGPAPAAEPDLWELVEWRAGPTCAVEVVVEGETVSGRSACVGFRSGASVRPALGAHEAGGVDAGPAVELSVTGRTGALLEKSRRGWTVPSDGFWAARWRLTPRPDTARDLRVGDGWVMGRGYDVVVLDWRDPGLAALQVRLPEGWRAHTVFPSRDPDPRDVLGEWFLFARDDSESQSVGPLRLVTTPGVELPAGFGGTWRSAVSTLSLLGPLGGEDFLFVMRPRETEGEPGGDSARRSARVVPWPPRDDPDAQLVGTLVHEYVHRLLPGRVHDRVAPALAGLDVPNDARWFTEGFAEWTTRRLLGRAGLLDAGTTLARLTVDDERSLLEAGEAAGDDPTADAVCYAGGALLAAWLDLQMTAAGEDPDAWFAFMRSLVDEDIALPMRASSVRDALLASTAVPVDQVEALDRYLESSDRPDAAALLAGLPEEVRRRWWSGP